MAYSDDSPATGHAALTDISTIRDNTNELRKCEASLSTSPPSNAVKAMFWWQTDTKKLYQRNEANNTWLLVWMEEGTGYGPAWYHTVGFDATERNVKNHFDKNITSSVTVHGIRQGAGNGFDSDKLDGNEASAFVGASHITATSGIHGVGAGEIVGTTLTQTLTNKTITSPTITSPVIDSIGSNISVAGAYIDGRDPSVDGAKLDTYPGSGAPADGSVTTAKIVDGNVTGVKVLDSSLSIQKLGPVAADGNQVLNSDEIASISIGNGSQDHKFYVFSVYSTIGNTVKYGPDGAGYINVWIERVIGSSEYLKISNRTGNSRTVYYKVFQFNH